jgi:hypothetical protein
MPIKNGEIVPREQEYISLARQFATSLWQAIHALQDLQSEWNALDYATTLPDGTGINEGYTAIQVGAVVFETADAMKAVLDAGHASNVAALL